MYQNLSEKAAREYAESILDVLTEANKTWLKRWKAEDEMSPALMEIIEHKLQEAKKEGIEKRIHRAVDILQNHGLSNGEIKKTVMKQYSLTEKEVEKFL